MSPERLRDYGQILTRLEAAVSGPGSLDSLGSIVSPAGTYPLQKIVLGQGGKHRVLISAGIHGDEPAGVEAVCAFLERKAFAVHLEDWEMMLVPCINPYGYEHGTRENGNGMDLNRMFKSERPQEEVRLMQSIFETPFDLTLELHEDFESGGYYFYHSGEPGLIDRLPAKILERVARVMPLNLDAEIDGSSAGGGVIDRAPNPENMDWWPMALFARSRGARYCLTLETAPAFPMEIRVEAHLAALNAALEHFPDLVS